MLTKKQLRSMVDGYETAQQVWQEMVDTCEVAVDDIVEFTYGDSEVRRLLITSVFLNNDEKLCVKGLRLKGDIPESHYRCYHICKMDIKKIYANTGNNYEQIGNVINL